MAITRRKALYIFLSSLLGMLLLLMFQRAVFVIYEILGSFYPSLDFLQLSLPTLFSIDFATMMLAAFIGGWYGVWLGLNWYHMIYEERGVTTWFHGFIPHHWRKAKSIKQEDKSEADSFLEHIMKSRSQPSPKRIVVRSRPNTTRTKEFVSTRAQTSDDSSTGWAMEESDSVSIPKKRVVRKKKVVRKAVRKVAKKSAVDAE